MLSRADCASSVDAVIESAINFTAVGDAIATVWSVASVQQQGGFAAVKC